MFRSVLSITLLVAAVIGGSDAAEWSYTDAANWGASFPNCAGKAQSGINFNRATVKTGTLFPIPMFNYDTEPATQTVTNDGHTIKVSFDSGATTPYIKLPCGFGGLSLCQYNFAQYHFHWGSVSSQGSEHTIDTKRYPMEVHLVHFNSKYGNIGTALSKSDGLAVLGILFVISQNDNPALAPLLTAIDTVKDYSATEHVDTTNMYALASLLPSNTKDYYRYKGSLTTPTCDESVTWTVFRKPIPVSEAQMAVFRAVVGTGGVSSNDNYRPIQAINGRKVEKSWK